MMNSQAASHTPLAAPHRVTQALRASAAKATAATIIALILCSAMVSPMAIAQQGATKADQGGASGGLTINFGGILNAIKSVTQRGTTSTLPVLQKRADAVGTPSGGNYTVNWVVSYANNSGAAQSNVSVVDGPIATIIPGSLKWSTGWTGTTAGKLPLNNYATWTGSSVPPHGVMTATLPSSSVGSVSLGGSGDGFQPIPYAHSSGNRIYIMNHHNVPGVALFDCIDLSSGGHCTGFPRTLPFGDGTNKSSGATSNNSEYVIDGSKFYYPAQNFAEWGIGCFDLESETQCGYTPLGSSSAKANQTQLQGPWRVGNELYLADYTGQVYCAKLAAGLPSCLSAGYKIPLTDIKLKLPSKTGKPDSTTLHWNNGLIAGNVVGTRLYLTSRAVWYVDHASPNVSTTTKYTNCFDTISKTACWSTTTPTRGTAANYYDDPYSINQSNYIYYSTSGTAQAICTKFDTPLPPSYQACTDLNTGNAITLPRIFPNQSTRNSLSVHVWPRTYFTGVSPNSGMGWCWDWSTSNYCGGVSGAFTPAYAPAKSEYGNNIDDNGCIWTYGHDNNLWGYDPSKIDPITKQAKPCAGPVGKATKTFKPLEYCSGPKPFHWTGVEVKSASMSNFDKFIIKVVDSTDAAVLMTKDLKAANATTLDISSLDAQTLSKPLKIEVEYTPKAGTSDKPYLEVRYDAPAPEFCFTSTHTCQQGKVTNTVETRDPKDPAKILKVQVDVAQPLSCSEVPCQTCGTASTAPCPPCGQAGQAPCPPCGQAGQPPCDGSNCVAGTPGCSPIDTCIAGTPGCPVIVIGGCIPGTFGCPPRTPRDTVCLTGDCPEKPKQSVAEEYKEPKTGCVRKPKPVEEPKKYVAPKPRPKPVVAAAPAAIDPNAAAAAPKPKPKPRPKPVAKPVAQDDDC